MVIIYYNIYNKNNIDINCNHYGNNKKYIYNSNNNDISHNFNGNSKNT